MRAGQVVRIRVNPKDCVSVLDVLRVAGVNTKGMSYSSIVSLAMSALLQGLRDAKTIPDRDGFEYLQMMEPYLRNGQGNKVKITNNIYGMASQGRVVAGIGIPTLDVDDEDEDSTAERPEPVPAEGPVTAEVRDARRRLLELQTKKNLIEDEVDGVLWSASDEQEWNELYKVVYPHG